MPFMAWGFRERLSLLGRVDLRLSESQGRMRRIEFVGPHFTPGGDASHGFVVLRILLRALVEINEDWLRRLGPSFPLLYQSNVIYRREEAGREEWQDCVETFERKWGDCEDLVCWRVAELRVRYGIKEARPDFTMREVPDPHSPSGIKRVFHIIVRIGPDREDPSRRLGMGQEDEWFSAGHLSRLSESRY